MADSAAFVRQCPSCGRRVPLRITQCRCGAALSDADIRPESAAEPERSGEFASGVRAALLAVGAIALIAFAVYWFTRSRADRDVAVTTPPVAPRVDPPAAATPSKETAAQPLREAPPVMLQPPAAPPQAVPPSIPAGASVEEVVSRVMGAVVLVETADGRGSGFFVAPDTLLTNVHVVGNSITVTIRRMDGSTAQARVGEVAPAFDVAILKLSNPAPRQAIIALGSSDSLRIGQEVIAIGSALGVLQNSVTRGIVSGVRRTGNATLVQTDAAVNPGNSGGPLLDRTGTAIGITTMGYRQQQGLNFAVAIDHARALLEGRPTATAPRPQPPAGSRDEYADLSPAVPTDSDRRQAEGLQAYEKQLAELARRADAFDAEWRRFREMCYSGSVVGTFDREWFALLRQGALPGAVSPRCTTYFSDIKRLAESFRNDMLHLEETARQAGVYPGSGRELRRKHQLTYEVWER